jgi:exopolyphosphatase/guanosine-5'-triphosphate,3'-diphosphate pyrophosphatase
MKLSAEELLNKYSKTSSHSIEVRRLAMMIFDEVNEKVHEMSNKQRKYLEAAALLHDIGYYIDAKGHNKHSMKMVVEHGLEGFNEREAMIIGCICRYHRGGLPDKDEHEIYNSLDKKERKIVKRLAGILKISDGLDRGHLNLIKKIHINYDEENNIVEFILTPNTPEFYPDITSAVRKRDLFEIGFKCQCVLKFE